MVILPQYCEICEFLQRKIGIDTAETEPGEVRGKGMIAKAPLVGRGTGVPFIGPSPRCRPSGTVISPQRRTPSAATPWYQVWSKSDHI